MINEKEKKVYEVLEKLNICYVRHEHAPVYTIEESDKLNISGNAQQCKNLFIRNRKGNEHYLVILDETKTVDLKDLQKQIGSTALSFASEERLDKFLGLAAGAVTPFGLINDINKSVTVLLDSSLDFSGTISFHPNVNTATIDISCRDFEKFLEWCGNRVSYVDV